MTQIGTLADFRAENFDDANGKLYDISDNVFTGTNNGATTVGNPQARYRTGTFTPTVTFGGAAAGLTYTTQEAYFTQIGGLCFVTGTITLSAKGSSTGSALIVGLPFTGLNTAGNAQAVAIGAVSGMATLGSAVTGAVVDSQSQIALYDTGSTGTADLDDTNFTNSSSVTFGGVYRIA